MENILMSVLFSKPIYNSSIVYIELIIPTVFFLLLRIALDVWSLF